MRNFLYPEAIARVTGNMLASVASFAIGTSLFNIGRSGDTTHIPITDIVTGQEYLQIPIHTPTSYILGAAALGMALKFAERGFRQVTQEVGDLGEE